MLKKLLMQRLSKLRFVILELLAFVVAAILLFGSGDSVSARLTPFFYSPPSGERIVYLASGFWSINSDLNMPINELQNRGVTVVYEVDKLLRSVDSNSVDAIIIHRSRGNEIENSRLAALYQKGIVISGVDISIHELASLVGDKILLNDSTWTDGWQKSPFFSIVAFKPTGTAEEQLAVQKDGLFLGFMMQHADNIRSSDDVDLFLARIRQDVAAMKEGGIITK